MWILTFITVIFLISASDAFGPHMSTFPTVTKSTILDMERRTFGNVFGTSVAVVLGANPSVASAKEFVPTIDSVKQIYILGMTLDSLGQKVADPETFEDALVGLRAFNRDATFYPNYARNFISKSVKNNADGDSRVGYIREAAQVIGSCQELLEGRQGLEGKTAAKEAVVRVKKSQALIAKFLAKSGVEGDEKINAFVKSH